MLVREGGVRAWLEVHVKGDVVGTEETGETPILALSSQAGSVSGLQFLPALMQKARLSKEQREGS